MSVTLQVKKRAGFFEETLIAAGEEVEEKYIVRG